MVPGYVVKLNQENPQLSEITNSTSLVWENDIDSTDEGAKLK